MKNAYYGFEQALGKLDSAKGYSDWDTFFGGGLFVDSVKHSRMSDARNLVQQAHHSLERAFTVVPTIPRVHGAHVEQGDLFWDVFMDNIFSDLSARGKINRSRESVRQALYQTNQALDWIQAQNKIIIDQFRRLKNEISQKRIQLTKERKRMIEDALKAKS